MTKAPQLRIQRRSIKMAQLFQLRRLSPCVLDFVSPSFSLLGLFLLSLGFSLSFLVLKFCPKRKSLRNHRRKKLSYEGPLYRRSHSLYGKKRRDWGKVLRDG